MKRFSILAILAILAIPAMSQTITAVSGTVLDPNGIPYANGTILPQLVNVSGGASPTVTANGSPVFAPPGPSTLSSSGTFNMGTLANGSITPGGTTWKFLICSAPMVSFPNPILSSPVCFTTGTITIAGATQSITTNINSASPPALTVQATIPNVGTGGVLKFGASTGLSLLATGVLTVGNGTAGDTSGSINATLADVESTCPVAAAGTDLFCADPILHAWTQSLNGAAYLPTPELTGDLGNTAASPQVISTHITGASTNVQAKFNATGNLVPSSETDNGTLVISTESATALTEGACSGNATSLGVVCSNSTVHSIDVSTNNSAFTGVPQTICANVTPVTVSTSTTADQNLQACTIQAGTLNRIGRTLNVSTAGIYSTPAASSAQMTLKAKLCTVSGCGSGTVVAVCNIQTTALGAIQITNDTWLHECTGITQTAGATAVFERFGRLSMDLLVSNVGADSIFLDSNATAVTASIDSTAQLFLQVSGAFSAASASNTMTGRSLLVWVSN